MAHSCVWCLNVLLAHAVEAASSLQQLGAGELWAGTVHGLYVQRFTRNKSDNNVQFLSGTYIYISELLPPLYCSTSSGDKDLDYRILDLWQHFI